jgi:hypothetical protein
MNENDLADHVNALPGRFAGRLAEDGLMDVVDAAQAGEWGEAVDILLAGLVKTMTPVTAGERDELLELLNAMGMPTDPIATLNVQG